MLTSIKGLDRRNLSFIWKHSFGRTLCNQVKIEWWEVDVWTKRNCHNSVCCASLISWSGSSRARIFLYPVLRVLSCFTIILAQIELNLGTTNIKFRSCCFARRINLFTTVTSWMVGRPHRTVLLAKELIRFSWRLSQVAGNGSPSV